MMMMIKEGWCRSLAAALMRCGGCCPLPRRCVGGLSAPLSVAAASCQACRVEPLLPVDDMEVRELGEQFHLRPFHLCQDLGVQCMHLLVRVEAVVDAHKDLQLHWVLARGRNSGMCNVPRGGGSSCSRVGAMSLAPCSVVVEAK